MTFCVFSINPPVENKYAQV